MLGGFFGVFRELGPRLAKLIARRLGAIVFPHGVLRPKLIDAQAAIDLGGRQGILGVRDQFFRLAESPALSTFEAEVQNRPGSDHQHEHGQDGEPDAMGPLAAGPLFFNHRQSAGFEQCLPADSAPAHFRSPGPFRCGLALMVPRYGTAHIYLAPILRFGFFQKGNLDDAATLRTGSAARSALRLIFSSQKEH